MSTVTGMTGEPEEAGSAGAAAEPTPGDSLAAEVQPADDPGTADTIPAGELGLAAERDRLARTLRDTRLQLAMTQARLSALERSASLEIGRALARAARRPWSQGVQLPLHLIRMWRERGSLTGPGTAALALASARLDDLAGVGERFLSALTAPGLGAPGSATARFAPPALVVTGVVSTQACAALAPDAAVTALLPHDADVMMESSGADLVLIEAAAMLASSPWAYASDPAAADRGRRLGRLIASARALGKPVIFIRNIPAHLAPGLDWVAASCDAVFSGGFGVQLASFNPIGLNPGRRCDPIYAGARDPREAPGVRTQLDSVASLVKVTGDIPWRRRPALYRDNGLFVTVSPDQAREQQACGARVIMVGDEQDDLRKLVTAAQAEPPLTEAEILPELREIFTGHATPVRLTALAELAGLAAGQVSGRQVAVLARVEDAAAAAALSASLRRQQMMPAEVVVTVAARPGEAVEVTCRSVAAALGDLGVTVQAIPDDGQASWLARAATAARSPWAAPWPAGREPGESYLLDLACGRECAQADAVGHTGTGYSYVTSLEPELARREFFSSDGSVQGLRLFSLS